MEVVILELHFSQETIKDGLFVIAHQDDLFHAGDFGEGRHEMRDHGGASHGEKRLRKIHRQRTEACAHRGTAN